MNAWWQKGGWVPPSPRQPVEIKPNDPAYLVFNPTCKHERTSYDIHSCEHCQQHSLKARWALDHKPIV